MSNIYLLDHSVTLTQQDGHYLAECPDIHCTTEAKTPSEALGLMAQAISATFPTRSPAAQRAWDEARQSRQLSTTRSRRPTQVHSDQEQGRQPLHDRDPDRRQAPGVHPGHPDRDARRPAQSRHPHGGTRAA